MASTAPPYGLLDLPAEIRNKIYRFALTEPDPIYPTLLRPRDNLSGQLLRCCKTIYVEASAILLSENKFAVTKASDLNTIRMGMLTDKRVGLVKHLVFAAVYSGGQSLLNKARLTELRKFTGLETLVFEQLSSVRIRRVKELRLRLTRHENFPTIAALVKTHPGVRVTYCAWYLGGVS